MKLNKTMYSDFFILTKSDPVVHSRKFSNFKVYKVLN